MLRVVNFRLLKPHLAGYFYVIKTSPANWFGSTSTKVVSRIFKGKYQADG